MCRRVSRTEHSLLTFPPYKAVVVEVQGQDHPRVALKALDLSK